MARQPALLLGDPEGQIARRWRPVLGRHAIARHVRHFGPVPDRGAVLALEESGGLGQRPKRGGALAVMSALIA
jgi:hypothetical protein